MLGFWQTNSGKLSLFTMLPSEDAGRSGALQMFPEPMRRAPPVKKTRYIKISRNVRVHVCPDYSGCQKKTTWRLWNWVIRSSPPKKVIQNDQITAKISWFISEFWGPISWTQKSGRNAQNGRRQTPYAPGSCAESLRRPRTGPWSRKWISAAWNMHEVWIVLNIYYSNRFVNDWRIVLYTMNSLWIIGE